VLPYVEILSSGAAILAMSFGKPVVAPDRGSLRDHVPPVAGDLYDPSDPRGLDRALEATFERTYRTERILAHARTLRWESLAEAFADGLRGGERRARDG